MKKTKNILIVILLVVLIIVAVGGVLGWKKIKFKFFPPFKVDSFSIQELKGEERPFTWDEIASLENDKSVIKDDEGIVLYQDKYYHPNAMANKGLSYLDSFNKTNNAEYLLRAEKYAQALKKQGRDLNDSLYFPYEFAFALHGEKDDVLLAPWYSGMAQGEALSLFVRLYETTQKKEYLETAEQIFTSFLNFKGQSSPWTVFVDKDRYYWIEEYTQDVPGQVLNGYIYGLYGVYDYYLIKKDNQSKEILDASLTTLKHYLPQYRSPGQISYYCLKHKKQSESYHRTHIKQLKMLYKITGDEFFKQMADDFYNDYH